MSGDFLAGMAQASRERSAAAQAKLPGHELRARVADLPAAPALKLGSFDLIAEVKLRSPAVGLLKDASVEDIGARVSTYAKAGAAAVSILTEPSRFDGSLGDLAAGARALSPLQVPAMRKDFLVDAYQVVEGRVAGAGGVLAIIRMLPRPDLEQLIDAALELDMFVLLEAFDARDIELAHALVDSRPAHRDLLLVGVNSRDLATLKVVPGRLDALAASLPTDVKRVAESGVTTAADAGHVAAMGYDLALVGSALMSAAEPALLARNMLAEARAAVAVRASLVAGRA
ncbi:MAG TPA: indole-3-glycerol-phosphate synthase [Steroidobacteraceae bacterium]|jgi:indole-3-glycerol phosphate synthase|nr:indole-3-glycerol-phosphate synthase [Steroidobacteraceae bacterium]